ncbi:MAG: hypothetical protein Q7R64_01530 [bacterium]|nr:hypothetical protein [bacterium]
MNNSSENMPLGDLRHITARRVILEGLRAVGIENDKITAFSRRLEDISLKLAVLLKGEATATAQDESSSLLREASRTDPYKNTQKAKEHITQWIEHTLGLVNATEEIRMELETLVSDIVDDEVAKHKQRTHDEE